MLNLFERFFGPIFAKEAIEISRQFRYYLARCALGLLLLWGVWLAAGATEGFKGSVGGDRARVQSAIAQSLIAQVASMQLLAVVLLAPALVCGAIPEERNAGTLELLFTTHLSDREIVFGKFGVRVLVLFLVTFAGVGVLTLVRLLGGITFAQIATVEILTVLAIVLASAMAIFFSTICRTSFTSLLSTYAALAGLAIFLGPFVIASLQSANAASTVAIGGGAGGVSAPVSTTSAYFGVAILLLFVATPLMLGPAILLVLAAVSRLRIIPSGPPERTTARLFGGPRNAAANEPAPEEEEDKQGVLAQKTALWGNLRIPVDRDDPPLSKNLWVFGVLGAALALCSYMFLVINPVGAGRISVFVLVAWMFVLPSTAFIAVTNPLFTRRPGFFDELLVTTLEPREILQGTVFVSWPVLVRLFAVPWAFSALWLAGNPFGLLFGTLVGTLYAFCLIAAGNLASLADQRPVRRLGAALLFPSIFLGAPWMFSPFADLSWRAWLAVAAGVAALTWWRTRRSISAPALGCHFVAVHFLLLSILVFTPYGLSMQGKREADAPMLDLASPLFWLKALLWEVPDDRRWNPWWSLAPLYALALGLQLFWSWRFTLGAFDRLTGRSHPDDVQRRDPRTAASVSA
jgi:ABC-type transport system involved in multi-copper enzyme maturation permease subunit